MHACTRAKTIFSSLLQKFPCSSFLFSSTDSCLHTSLYAWQFPFSFPAISSLLLSRLAFLVLWRGKASLLFFVVFLIIHLEQRKREESCFFSSFFGSPSSLLPFPSPPPFPVWSSSSFSVTPPRLSSSFHFLRHSPVSDSSSEP